MDWAGFEATSRAGEIPRLTALRQRGVGGWLSGAPQSLGPAAAVSLVTGVQPEVHGVWRAEEEWPGGVRPVSRTSWRAQPLWERLEAAGVSSGSIDWPGSRPGAGWQGLHIDDEFAEASGRTASEWALPLRCASSDCREALRSRRVHPSQITAAMLAPLVPPTAFQDGDHEERMLALAAGMSRAATLQSAAVWMLGESGEPPPEAVFLHQPILQHSRRAFEAGDDEVFAGVVPGAWRLLDGLIGRLAELAGTDALVLVCSGGWRGAPGVILAAGKGVRVGAEFEGANLVDLAPTVLGVFGLEDPQLPGRRLTPIASPTPLRDAPRPMLPGRLMPDIRLMRPLRLVGYKPPRRPPRGWRAERLAELGLLMLERDPAGALRVAEAALALDGDSVFGLRIKVRAQVALQQPEGLDAIGDRLLALAPGRGWGALAHGARHILRREVGKATPWLNKAETDTDVGSLLTLATLWVAAGRLGRAEGVFRRVLELDLGNVTAEIGMAIAAAGRRDFLEAEVMLNRAKRREPGRPAVWLQLAQIYARSGRKAEAERMAETARRLGAAPALAGAAAAGRLRG